LPSALQQRVETYLSTQDRLVGVAHGHDHLAALAAQQEWEQSIVQLHAEIERMVEWGFLAKTGAIGGLRRATRLGTSAEDIASTVFSKYFRAVSHAELDRAASVAWIKTACARELFDLHRKIAREPAAATDMLDESLDAGEGGTAAWHSDAVDPEQEADTLQLRQSLNRALEEAHKLIRVGRMSEPDHKRWLWQRRRLFGESWDKILKTLPPNLQALQQQDVNTLQAWVVRYHRALAKQCLRLPAEHSAVVARLLDYIDRRDDAATNR
jgi:hypothetical protein